MSDVLPAGFTELARGTVVTVALTLCAGVVSLVSGAISATLQVAGGRFGRFLGRAHVSLMRGTPALIQLFVVFFGLPLIGLGGHPFWAATTAIGLNSAAYVSEILRGAILAIPEGQIAAANAIGMAPRHRWLRIVLPQALTASLPALANEATLLLKTTPLASVVAVTDLTFAGQIVIARTFRPVDVLLPVTAVYLVIALMLTQAAGRLERRRAVRR
jgi:polar amino acid transport system permease protein